MFPINEVSIKAMASVTMLRTVSRWNCLCCASSHHVIFIIITIISVVVVLALVLLVLASQPAYQPASTDLNAVPVWRPTIAAVLSDLRVLAGVVELLRPLAG